MHVVEVEIDADINANACNGTGSILSLLLVRYVAP